MDATLEAFRARVRSWLEQHAEHRGWTRPAPLDEPDEVRIQRARTYQRLLFEAGLAGITWPRRLGGQGLGIAHQIVFDQETAPYHLPITPLVITLGICGPALLAMGSDAQQQRHVPAMLRGDQLWCQLYSEPGAGSDIASLSTRAVRAADGFRVSGQKVWTSGARHCAFGLLLARTNPDVPKHVGLTLFILDMTTPGIDVRPLRQMNGGARFNEVFLDDVAIPDDAVVGAVDDGWRAATAMLMTERVTIGAGNPGRDAHAVATLIDAAHRAGTTGDAVVRQQLVGAYARERVADLVGRRIAAGALAGRPPGPESSTLKLIGTSRSQRAATLGVDLQGAAAQAWDGRRPDDAQWAGVFLAAPGLSIAGGTSEVQKNVIGERVLGLPREPRTDTTSKRTDTKEAP